MGRYQADPDDNTKSSPKSLPTRAFQQVTSPAAMAVVDRPIWVYIANEGDGDISFEFGSGSGYVTFYTRSEAPSLTFDTGSTSTAVFEGNLERRFENSPTSWSGSAGSVVNFVYRGGI